MNVIYWIGYKNFIFKWERTILAIIAVAFGLAPILTLLIIDTNAIHSRIAHFKARDGYPDLEIYAREFASLQAMEDYRKALSDFSGVSKATYVLMDSVQLQDQSSMTLLASPAWDDAAFQITTLKGDRQLFIEENEAILPFGFARRYHYAVGTEILIRGVPVTVKHILNSDEVVSINGAPTLIMLPDTFIRISFVGDAASTPIGAEELPPSGYVGPILNNDPDLLAVIDAIKKNAPLPAEGGAGREAGLKPVYWVKLQDLDDLFTLHQRLSSFGVVKIPEYHFINNRSENRVMRNTLKMTGIFAFVLGLFIIYNSFAYSTIERQKDMALLNGIGLSKIDLIRLLLLEGVCIGIAGTVLSLAISIPSSFLLAMKNISTLGSQKYYITTIPGGDILIVMVIGVLCVLASITYSGFLVFNIDSARLLNPKGFAPYRLKLLSHPFWFVFSLLFVLMNLLVAFIYVLDVVDLDYLSGIFRGAGVIAIGVVFISFFPKIIEAATRLAAHFFRVTFRNDGMIAYLLWQSDFKTHLLAIVGITTIFSIIYTTKITTQAITHELFRWAREPTENKLLIERKNISLNTIRSLRQNLDRNFIYLPIYPYVHVPYNVKGMDLNLLLPHIKDSRIKTALARYQKGKGVVITRALAAELNKSEGDTIRLNSLYGAIPFEILMVSDAFGYFNDDRNYILMPARMGIELFSPIAPPADKLTIVKAQPDRPDFTAFTDGEKRQILRTLYDEPYRVKLTDGNWLYVQKIAKRQRDFSIFNYIWFFCIVVGGIGIFNSIIIKAIEKKDELALLNVLGLHRGQFFKIMLIHSLLIGLAGGLFAVIVAQPLTYIAIYSFKQFTGFDVEYFIGGRLIFFFLGLSLVTSVAAALYPTYKISKESLSRIIRYE